MQGTLRWAICLSFGLGLGNFITIYDIAACGRMRLRTPAGDRRQEDPFDKPQKKHATGILPQHKHNHQPLSLSKLETTKEKLLSVSTWTLLLIAIVCEGHSQTGKTKTRTKRKKQDCYDYLSQETTGRFVLTLSSQTRLTYDDTLRSSVSTKCKTYWLLAKTSRKRNQ